MSNKDNPRRGAKLEEIAKSFFYRRRLQLEKDYEIELGASNIKEKHKFDLGSKKHRVLVECKNHKWTSGSNSPSAKLSVWNEAMYYFLIAPKMYRKILFVKKSMLNKLSLARHYIKRYKHMIPKGVEIWEYNLRKKKGKCIYRRR